MNSSQQNAQYIQLLNQNIKTLSQNIETLEKGILRLEESIGSLGRDAAAMQGAMVAFLKEKEIIKGEEDFKLLQKLHIRQLARLDQEIAAHQEKRKK